MPTDKLPPVKVTGPPASAQAVPARGPPSDSLVFPIVGIGASAGGLEACRKLIGGLPASNGMAFILIQHLDPTHESMMVDLLSGSTSMSVRQAKEGMSIERDHLYVIPPGTYLSVGDGVLHVSQPQERHGARLPFDFLLRSMADDFGPLAVCVILSGTGADGSLGLKAVKQNGGLVIAQNPEEAGYDGMPRGAISTGMVDFILPVAEIGSALIDRARQIAIARTQGDATRTASALDWLSEIIDLLRAKTDHDFTLYKRGTLQRRIERRMAMLSIGTNGMKKYLDVLHGDSNELELLAKDLLINVTNFFRDPEVFKFLAETTIPELIKEHPIDQALRVWVAGCSTGEETYSVAMLFLEGIAASNRNIKLQVFASDVDTDAVASAREGLYPESIQADVSPERLARFFSKEDRSYRVSPALRAIVVFTVQDVLTDPPFSRIDFVSCRNLLIYLQTEAQAKAMSAFHFALREGGLLLLGSSETVGSGDGRFAVVSKATRLYRRVGRNHQGDFGFSRNAGGATRSALRLAVDPVSSRQAALADLCKQLVIETYAPAAVLINRKYECLYYLGPTDRYLKIASGRPMHDLLTMAREGMRTKLRSAIQRAIQENARIVVQGGRIGGNHDAQAYSIAVQPTSSDGEELLLICFIDQPLDDSKEARRSPAGDVPRVIELEKELDATRTELEGAIHNLEISGEEQKAINEEALSVNEEFQSTNEELLTSKEELQSLNEELTALNSQLQETLDRQRTTSNDLQNILYSTDVATLFLDTQLNIRFFTPATKSLFNVIPGDIGRPLADLSSLASDRFLLKDARTVLQTLKPIEREIEANSGEWYGRRILPYRTQDNGIEGVVITFDNVTGRKETSKALEAAKQQADSANLAKSRFLAVASHDLRQPLQSLALIQGLLAKVVEGEKARKLVGRIEETLAAMSGMLNALLDINQIEAGIVRGEVVRFPINELLNRLRDEFTYLAKDRNIELRVVACGASIDSDPRLLEQMIRNLLGNALKYTENGKVLLGCRRHKDRLTIQVWDTGIGIPEKDYQAIFGEFHQLDNAARERSRGLGLGLSIVQRLGRLLGHQVSVRSVPGKGSVFTVDIDMRRSGADRPLASQRPESKPADPDAARGGSDILVVEDDPELRQLLELLLEGEGHRAVTAPDGVAAQAMLERRAIRPDLILTDFNLPNGLNGLQLATALRKKFELKTPVIILTGDISTETLRDIAGANCVQLNKPVNVQELISAIQRLLPAPRSQMPAVARNAATVSGATAPVIYVVDDDGNVRDAIRSVLEDEGWAVEDFACCEAFLEAYHAGGEACLLVDAYLPGMSGLELLSRLHQAAHRLPAIMMTGNSDVQIAVQAMKAGASDFVEKPIGRHALLDSIQRAFEQSRDANKLVAWQKSAASQIAELTPRQRQIMDLVLAGHPSKNIAADLGISQRTVENHRAEIMTRTGAKSLPALARLALAAARTAQADV
ncbi:chemotaxis protein CheB [Hyphomicrobium sp. MC1]|uniref:chemotaxis protein CheB n=1 Tax=Hyphomicrobium sp. (strain MC1) TaxID=717785 RepID=UPI000213E697|nr:chemotaxis protein CheB [Hyphomicrobium sp. MC1]CCB66516.1 CheB methylesterase:MCP methyltransferase, CheR-type [Hyphomicrobium sp. MC1]